MPQKKGKFKFLRSFLLLLNIIALLGLIFALVSPVIPPSGFPYLTVFGLIYPILLFLNLSFIVFWLLLRSKYFLLSLVVILIGYQNLFNNLQFNARTSKTHPETVIKVFTNNVKLFGAMDNKPGKLINYDEIERFIKTTDPDIVCLQEYYSTGITQYGPLADMKKSLGAETYYFESYIKPKGNHLSGLVIFSKYPVVNTMKLKFPGTRTFGIATDIVVESDTIRVYNIHLASIALNQKDIDFVVTAGQEDKQFSSHAFLIYSKLYEAYLLREEQIKFITDQINSSPHHVILAGDFNDTPSSYVYAQITDLLQDTFKEKGKGVSITFAGQLPFLRIDYIMKSIHFRTLKYSRHKVGFSDHYPVSVELSFE